MAIKRLHYFDHQFLVQADFTDEQTYHLDMRRRLNRLLHTFGIAEGLEVVKSANKTVTVRPGVALDRLGQEMIVEANQVVDLTMPRSSPRRHRLHHHRLPGTGKRSDPSYWRLRQHPYHRAAPHPGRHDCPADRRHGHSPGPLYAGRKRQRARQYQRPLRRRRASDDQDPRWSWRAFMA